MGSAIQFKVLKKHSFSKYQPPSIPSLSNFVIQVLRTQTLAPHKHFIISTAERSSQKRCSQRFPCIWVYPYPNPSTYSFWPFKPVYTKAFKPVSGSMWQSVVVVTTCRPLEDPLVTTWHSPVRYATFFCWINIFDERISFVFKEYFEESVLIFEWIFQIELNLFWARFNVWMNNQNVSNTCRPFGDHYYRSI